MHSKSVGWELSADLRSLATALAIANACRTGASACTGPIQA